jgi:hypothetical protein
LLFFVITMARVVDPEVHWTMVAFMPLAVAVGAWLDDAWERRRAGVRLVAVAATLSAVFTLVGWSYTQTPSLVELIPERLYNPTGDVVNEMVGWDDVTAAIRANAARLGSETVVASCQYALCANVLTQLDDQPKVYCPSVRRTEFDFIDRRTPPPSAPVLYVANDHYGDDPAQLMPDRRCRPTETVEVKRGERVTRRYRLYACLPPSAPETRGVENATSAEPTLRRAPLE